LGLKEYRDILFDTLGYKPSPEQDNIHADTHRIKQVSGGERAGKSYVGGKEALTWIPRTDLIWVVGQEYGDARREYEYIAQDLIKLSLMKPITIPKEGPLSMKTVTNCIIETHAAADYLKLGKYAPGFILVCEGAQIPFEAYLRLRGRIAEKQASMMLTGTMEGSLGWWPEYIKRGQAPDPEFKSFILPTWSNHHVFPPGNYEITLLNGTKLKNVNKEIYDLWVETPLDVFMERYGAVPQPVAGIVTPEFSNAIHVGDYQYDPAIPVEIAVDPGYGGAYVVLAIQVKESIPYIVDEVYLQGYVTEDIITIVQQKPWGHAFHEGSIDIAGKQHQAMAAPIEVWLERTGILLQTKYVAIDDGIDLIRTALKVNPLNGRPKLYINSSCWGVISECGGGKSPVQGGGAWTRDANTGRPLPKNDHACKAYIYWHANKIGFVPRSNEYGKLYKPGKGGVLEPAGRRTIEWLRMKETK
jgi:hypothetical protein